VVCTDVGLEETFAESEENSLSLPSKISFLALNIVWLLVVSIVYDLTKEDTLLLALHKSAVVSCHLYGMHCALLCDIFLTIYGSN
jgi:hypothetical protein